jgi:hypothetical protein
VIAGRSWSDKVATAGIVLFAVDVCLFFSKLVFFGSLYGKHNNLLVGCSWIGLMGSTVASVFILFDMRKISRVLLALGSFVLTYLWFSSLAWWVMVK